MHQIFNTLIDSFIADRIGIAENFLTKDLSFHLKKNLLRLQKNNELVRAGTGDTNKLIHGNLYRTDRIHWLDRDHNNEYENTFLDLVEEFIVFLNETCYTGITGYEFHYTIYEKGDSYKKHIDQFRHNDSRKFSMVIYLNDNWQHGDGGELCIYQDLIPQFISPLNGKSVFFRSSEMEHEVLCSHKPRLSITGWLKS